MNIDNETEKMRIVSQRGANCGKISICHLLKNLFRDGNPLERVIEILLESGTMRRKLWSWKSWNVFKYLYFVNKKKSLHSRRRHTIILSSATKRRQRKQENVNFSASDKIISEKMFNFNKNHIIAILKYVRVSKAASQTLKYRRAKRMNFETLKWLLWLFFLPWLKIKVWNITHKKLITAANKKWRKENKSQTIYKNIGNNPSKFICKMMKKKQSCEEHHWSCTGFARRK